MTNDPMQPGLAQRQGAFPAAAPDSRGVVANGASSRTPLPPPSDIAPADEGKPRSPRRSLAQREAAAKGDLAALATEKRRLRTRGAIVAGGLLTRVVRQRADLREDVANALRTLSPRDREALVLFMPELS